MLKVHAKKLDAAKVLCLEGQIVNGETEILRSAVQLAPDDSDIILNLSNVTVVDAHGLGVLLQLREETRARGANFELVNVNRNLYRVFEITRLNTVFTISSETPFIPEIPCSERMLVAA